MREVILLPCALLRWTMAITSSSMARRRLSAMVLSVTSSDRPWSPSVENPHKAVDLYIVEAGTPGFEKGRKLKKIGWHSQDTAELFFTDCRVPKGNRLGEKGSGFRMLMEKLQQERLVCAIGAQALAERILEITITYCKERSAFGKPISKFQNTQFRIVEMATEVKLGRTFLDKLLVEHMEGLNVVLDVSMAKFWITDMAMRVIDGCLQLHGG